MTESDKPRLARVLAVLAETFNETVSEIRAEGYLMGLVDLSIEQVEAAAKAALKSSKFFPRPAELRELAVGSVEDHAEAAWSKLLGEVRRVGAYGAPKLPDECRDVMVRLWGTWGHLCATLPCEGPELLGWAKRFKAIYASANPIASAKGLSTPSMFPELTSGDR